MRKSNIGGVAVLFAAIACLAVAALTGCANQVSDSSAGNPAMSEKQKTIIAQHKQSQE